MAIEQAVDDKIRTPAGIRTLDLRPHHPPAAAHVPAWPLPPQMKSLLAVDPVGPFMVDAPALAPKQDLDPPISVADPRFRDLNDP